ncbi:hypothetical protein CYMTET_36655 [Cymbomonas tetramitiformis]|uniref:Fe2OG dioxygenase domain-containing protein n=1 Tax=Cymbomonas tetramitiformis TaxID=36881 RepID=A0AAE0F6S7_9CHLO|nr:hypothetical protein CYMTET_36655 [Cymbomonas tetramitiformis]
MTTANLSLRSPRSFVKRLVPSEVPNFLTPEECEHLKTLALPLLAPSLVSKDGVVRGDESSATRNSWSALLPHPAMTDDPIIKSIGRRVAELTQDPLEHQEPIQVVRYSPGQYFSEHFDAGRDFSTLWLGQRKITVLLYLNEDFTGGNTLFPKLDMSIKPSLGKALLFRNLSPLEGGPQAEVHPQSLHAGEAVTAGEKWAINIWIRERPYLISTQMFRTRMMEGTVSAAIQYIP